MPEDVFDLDTVKPPVVNVPARMSVTGEAVAIEIPEPSSARLAAFQIALNRAVLEAGGKPLPALTALPDGPEGETPAQLAVRQAKHQAEALKQQLAYLAQAEDVAKKATNGQMLAVVEFTQGAFSMDQLDKLGWRGFQGLLGYIQGVFDPNRLTADTES